MIEREAKRNQLLDALDEHALVRAALVFDGHGNVRARRGEALALGSAAVFGERGGRRGAKENVYLVAIGPEFLLVIFDDKAHFDRIKADVKGWLDELALAV